MVEWSDIEAKRGIAETKARQAVEFGARGNTLADELRKAIGERFAQSDIAKQGAEARTGFLAAAPQARADISGLIQGGAILSPTQQQALMASKRGAALAPVMGANVMQEAAFGTLEDLINAGVNAYNAQTQQVQGIAGLAQQSYTNLLNELIQKANMEYQQGQLAIAKATASKRNTEIRDINNRTVLVDTQTGEVIKDLGQTKKITGTKAPVYGDNEATRLAGIVGLEINTGNNDLLSQAQQYIIDREQTEPSKIPSGEQIEQFGKEGYQYNPVAQTWTKTPPRTFSSDITNLFRNIGTYLTR